MASNRMTRDEAAADPATANAAVDKIINEVEKPVIPLPPSDLVTLPGGLIHRGEVVRTVRVQELKGSHEEALARAIQPAPGTLSINWANFLTVLLECGTVEFVGLEDLSPKELLKDLLLGDRDAVILGIRQATYGDEVELKSWQCPQCGAVTDLTISLAEDVEVVSMNDPREDATFEVKLRRNRTATVKLCTGRDLTAMYDREGLNNAERESIMLSKCLMKIAEADGTEARVQGRAGAIVMDLSIPDRKSIVRELEKRQPGPRYNGIKFTHQDCQKEVPLAVGLGDLFPDLF